MSPRYAVNATADMSDSARASIGSALSAMTASIERNARNAYRRPFGVGIVDSDSVPSDEHAAMVDYYNAQAILSAHTLALGGTR